VRISSVDIVAGWSETSWVQTRNEFRMGSERINDRRVPAPRDHDPADPRHVVARIERPPRPVEEHFDPGAKIHGVADRHADVSEMSVDVARRDIETPAKRHGEMCEIATDADPLLVRFECGSGRSRLLIVELDVLLDEIANGLNPPPAGRGIAEQVQSYLA
jgi:hypothetical protein